MSRRSRAVWAAAKRAVAEAGVVASPRLVEIVQRAVHPTETPEYWEREARRERALAAEDRARRHGTVESIRVHEANAVEYEARASALRAARDGAQ